ncbi:DUF6588 family protein [Lutibacter sp. TH_r2]|uniref:DUF6588 family protein n=1 Tax=Lutibacter sp. TH_r2 TaxID=3082083 RepID=UPI0029537730|nr:DUF6588 family protein [Lutibacter sp. TH_r2]MDV7186013.1 DUF6588 family protein [Lutibacter sp. TH_r2]
MKKLSLLFIGLLLSISSKSQELEYLLLASDDASLLMKNYMSPVMEGMQSSLNNGWYHTAKTHKKFGFDITILANAAMVPTSSQSFQFNAADYQYVTLESGSSTVNTVMGGANNTEFGIRIPEAENYKVASFSMPNGIKNDVPLNSVPSPMLQASVGLFFDTDITIRYMPEIKTDEVEGNLIGLGLKHNLMQYLGPLEKLPLNISIFGGFTKMDAKYLIGEIDGLAGTNQEVVFELNTFTIQTIASLDFPVISLYGGIGLEKGTSTLKLNGTYELEYDIEDSAGNTIGTIQNSVTDPISMNFDTNEISAKLGARLNLGFFKVFGDYSIKEYNTVTAGIAFSFR